MTNEGLTKDGEPIDLTVSEELRENGLEHVSKSRLKTYMSCPFKFWAKYWCENRAPGNFYTDRGTEVHRTFEEWHENLIEHIEAEGTKPEWYHELLEDWRDYGQWLDPFVVNFWRFEDRRWELAKSYAEAKFPNGPVVEMALEIWKPFGVEVEGRLDEPPIGDLPWMGFADALLHAATVPGIEAQDGVVILDYKTGSVPDEEYREDGIYLEGEFYGWLFEEELDEEIAGVAGYYPVDDELIVSPYPNEDRRHEIRKAVLGMQQPPDEENYPIEEQPLCHYGHGKCFFYDDCDSTWGKQDGAGWHNKAEPDGGITPKDE